MALEQDYQRERERKFQREKERDAAEELEAIGGAEEGANLRHLFDCSSRSSKVPKFSDPFKLPTVIPPSLSFQILLGLIQKKKESSNGRFQRGRSVDDREIATVSLLHSFIPTHWLPFSIVGRAQKWTLSPTLLVSMFSNFFLFNLPCNFQIQGFELCFLLISLSIQERPIKCESLVRDRVFLSFKHFVEQFVGRGKFRRFWKWEGEEFHKQFFSSSSFV